MAIDSPRSARAHRDAATASWGLREGIVVVPSGLLVPIAGTDQFHDYHAHNEHAYLAGTAVPGSALAFDPREGWILFAPVASQEDRVWLGDGEPLEALAARSGIDRVHSVGEFGAWLERRRGEPLAVLGNPDLLVSPGVYGVEGWAGLELEVDEELGRRLSEAVSELRRTKDENEIELMRQAAACSRLGHIAAMRIARPGLTERGLQVELEAEFFRAGSNRTAYGSIVGSGPNGAVLHCTPTSRRMREGEMVLIDAGAEWNGYASDVTRTFPVGARYEGIHRDLYQLVLGVQESAIASVAPGKEYRDLHLDACVRVAEGLVQLGILRGTPEDLVDRDAHALFFPHGLGHMLGLATHDAGGCLAGRTRSERFGLKWLRADLPLEPGYVVTIEPGIYFIRALLTDPAVREKFRDPVDWDSVDRLHDLGGIRIEDDVLVTPTGHEVLTAGIPKATGAIESLRQEALD